MDIEILILIGVFVSSLVSGIIGMAGGIILMGIYATLLPIEVAMVLHGFTQLFSNGFRSYLHRKHILWHILPKYFIGSLIMTFLMSLTTYTPDKKIVFIMLGLFPFTIFLKDFAKRLDISKKLQPYIAGGVVTASQLTAGASGSILDIFFINSPLLKYEVIGSKAITQVVGHSFKILFYISVIQKNNFEFGISPISVALTVPVVFIGTYLGKLVLRHFNEDYFRKLSRIIVLGMGILLVLKGVYAYSTQ
jgi:uncharacterized membrane protein YfcA